MLSGKLIHLIEAHQEQITLAVIHEIRQHADTGHMRKLPDAEKSALKGIEIDKTHNDPRIYFLLAQIYEAKGEPENEAAQLRQYLKFASDPNDAAMVKAYLAELEKRAHQ